MLIIYDGKLTKNYATVLITTRGEQMGVLVLF